MRRHLIQVKSELLQSQGQTWQSIGFVRELRPQESRFAIQKELAHLTDHK